MLKIIRKEGIEENLKALLEKKLFWGKSAEEEKVLEIIKAVKKKGDEALKEFSLKFDNQRLTEIKVSEEEINNSPSRCGDAFLAAIDTAIENIRAFHQNQKSDDWFESTAEGNILGMRVIPIEKVGLYVPGGKASYPSSVLMNAIPAQIAGVTEISIVTPPPVSPYILAAAKVLGINNIYQIGGAQAIAALAFGTETIPRVDKIVGPGNKYVALAKKLLFGAVGIESIAGPSDILIIADKSASPKFIAADLLAQAEHDTDASSILITTSSKIAEEVVIQIKEQIKELSRKEIIEKSIAANGLIFVVDSINEAIEIGNQIAPEHLELMVTSPHEYLENIKNAGAVFMGPYTPVALGDYLAGPNHVLPTSGNSRFASPLSVYDFVKRQSVLAYTKEELMKAKDEVMLLAKVEGLDAHANSLSQRI